MNSRERSAQTKNSTSRPRDWRLRARVAWRSVLACALFASTLLLSGSVRALRGTRAVDVDRAGADVTIAAPSKQALAFEGQRLHVAPNRIFASPDVQLGSHASGLRDIAYSSGGHACSPGLRAYDIRLARGYDATAPPRDSA